MFRGAVEIGCVDGWVLLLVLVALVVRLWLGHWTHRGGIIVNWADKRRETRGETVDCGWVICSSPAGACGCRGGLGGIGWSNAATADETVCDDKEVACVGDLSKDTA